MTGGGDGKGGRCKREGATYEITCKGCRGSMLVKPREMRKDPTSA